MIQIAAPQPPPARVADGTRCRRIGRFIAKGGCFALRGESGDVWLEVNPIPLHLLDEQVAITGRCYGAHILVELMGPAEA